jgi:hypothetical protein
VSLVLGCGNFVVARGTWGGRWGWVGTPRHNVGSSTSKREA